MCSNQCWKLTFVYMLLLIEGQMGEKSNAPSEIDEHSIDKCFRYEFKGMHRSQYHWHHRYPWHEWKDGGADRSLSRRTVALRQRRTTFRRLKTSASFYFRKSRVNFVAYYQANTESHFVHNWQPCISGLDQVPSRSSLLWDVRWSRLVGAYRRFGKTIFKGQAVKEESPQYT
jgi:hypothetical protein